MYRSFTEINAITVYELLEHRYGGSAKKQLDYVFTWTDYGKWGKALHRSISYKYDTFSDISLPHMIFSILHSTHLGALAYTYFGGVKSVILSDVHSSHNLCECWSCRAFYLYTLLDDIAILDVLQENNKLLFIDTSLDGKFSLIGLLSGWLLLNIAAFGLDQDMATENTYLQKQKRGIAFTHTLHTFYYPYRFTLFEHRGFTLCSL
ncbi:MAG: hypothetical protein Q9M40_05795 [Sulfurimonas sp.]|nr:hypothetical protein [Sulfurimonas sp.]